ncbi:septum formation initiator family protein [Brachybacterium sp. EF45031]|uniref:FtsB family cell division protein n=1 Tax=Brachybacterium sillae TaxID=2810536 RepID=UPI00217F13EE|nr:septum formation initiator family protein [Brachybacterium sillae]MCS6712665.1 septum formation initiator family protein [Brachybacterium sillae]
MTARRPGAPRTARRPVAASPHGAASRPRPPASAGGAAARTGRRPGRGGPAAAGSRPARSGASSAGSRPAGAARPRSDASGADAPEGLLGGLTRRGLALIAVTVIALALLLPTVNSYVAQRQQLQALERQVTEQQADVERLEAEVARWDDPTFVAAQARERLLFVMPGETQYRLTDTSGRPVPRTESEQARAEAQREEWFAALWTSVEGASVLSPDDVPESPSGDPQQPTPTGARPPQETTP